MISYQSNAASKPRGRKSAFATTADDFARMRVERQRLDFALRCAQRTIEDQRRVIRDKCDVIADLSARLKERRR